MQTNQPVQSQGISEEKGLSEKWQIPYITNNYAVNPEATWYAAECKHFNSFMLLSK